MAGRGPAPKAQRLRRNVPTHGDYVRLEPLASPVLPALTGTHTALASAYWSAWSDDPVTALWTPAEVVTALHLVELIEDDPVKHAAEIRMRLDGLGLTAKGRRDARLLLPEEELLLAEETAPTPIRALPEAK